MSFTKIDPSSPAEILALEAPTNQIFTLTPAVIYDTRDSIMLPSEGYRLSLAYEYAGQVLPGDFDFWKTTSMRTSTSPCWKRRTG